jgi:hypothetical protein
MAVQRWAAYIKRSAPFKESLRLIEATLFDHLVAQLDAPTKAAVDTEVLWGTFEAEEDPYAKAGLLVDFLTREPPQKTLQRYLDSFEETVRIKRNAYSSMAEYIAHYSGAASKFLRLMGADHGDTIEYLLAVTMMANAQLSPQVLQSAKLALQRRAIEATDRSSIAERMRAVVFEKLFRIKGVFEQLVNTPGKGTSSSPGTTSRDSVSATKWLFMKEAESLEKEIDALIPRNVSGPVPLTASSRFDLRLQDASQTLLTLGGEAPRDGKLKAKESPDQRFERRFTEVGKTLLSVQKHIKKIESRAKVQKGAQNPATNNPGQSSRGSGRSRARGECWDCSSSSHFRGDRSCHNPSERTRKAWAEEDLASKNS